MSVALISSVQAVKILDADFWCRVVQMGLAKQHLPGDKILENMILIDSAFIQGVLRE